MQHHAALQELLERLRASRVRLVVKRLLYASIWVAIVAAGIFVLLALLQYLDLVTLTDRAKMLTALGVLIGGILGNLLRVWRTAPDAMHLARLADKHYGLEERLSTALEGGDAQGSPIRAALLKDVARRIDGIHAAELVTIPLPRSVWFLMAMISTGLLLQLAPLPSNAVVSSAEVTMTAEDRMEVAAQVRRAATLVAQDAEQQNDTYLRALAQALERFGSDIEHEHLSAEAVERELARLVDHLMQAYGLEERVGAGIELAAILSPEEGGLAENETVPSGSLPNDDHALIETRDMGGIDTAHATTDLHSILEDLVTHLEADNEGQQQPVASVGEAVQVQMQTFGYDQIDPELRARIEREREIMARLRPEVPMGGDMGGAGEGASVEAGVGSQPLFDEDGQPLAAWEASNGDDVDLPFDPDASRRIRVEAAPQEELTDVEAVAIGGGGWRRHDEVAVARGFVAVGSRAVASRYFMSAYEANE